MKNPKHIKQNYKLVVFKLDGHETWRVNNLSGMKNTKGKVTEKKLIEVDIVTGKITITE